MTRINRRISVLTLGLCAVAAALPAVAMDPSRAQARANFVKADINQDRHLDYAEFKIFINLNADHNIGRASMIRRFNAHDRAFLRVDLDRDGRISPAELSEASNR